MLLRGKLNLRKTMQSQSASKLHKSCAVVSSFEEMNDLKRLMASKSTVFCDNMSLPQSKSTKSTERLPATPQARTKQLNGVISDLPVSEKQIPQKASWWQLVLALVFMTAFITGIYCALFVDPDQYEHLMGV